MIYISEFIVNLCLTGIRVYDNIISPLREAGVEPEPSCFPPGLLGYEI